MRLTKTTFELDVALLAQLKTTAARVHRSVRELLTEGAQTMLEKYHRVEDYETLQRRADETEEQFIGSFRGGPNSSATIDQVLYAAERPVEYGTDRKPARRKK